MTSTSYPHDETDWRGVFMRHLVEAIARRADVDLALWAPPGKRPHNVGDASTATERAWLARLMAEGGISHVLRHLRPTRIAAPFTLLRMIGAAYRRAARVDLYHVNWLQCALPLPDNRVPALISVLGNDLKLLRLPLMRPLLRRVMRRRRVILCPNAEWMRAPLEAAFGDLAEVHPVSFGIDRRWFDIERDPGDRPVWLAVTRLTADKLGPLFEWSQALFGKARELHLFGPMQEAVAVPAWVHYHGAVDADMLARDWFPRATGLITLSRHAEGRPQVMLEAMASSLPIIASRTPAHAGIVREGRTGLLCASTTEYAEALTRLEHDPVNRRFGAEARAEARSEFGIWDDCATRYAGVYRVLLEQST